MQHKLTVLSSSWHQILLTLLIPLFDELPLLSSQQLEVITILVTWITKVSAKVSAKPKYVPVSIDPTN